MTNKHNDHEKTVQQLVRELQQAREAADKVQWKPVPSFPLLEVSKDGALRLCRPVKPSESGMIQVQHEGTRLSCSAVSAHKAAWPELWPAAPAVDLRPTAPPSSPDLRVEAPKPLSPDDWLEIKARFRRA